MTVESPEVSVIVPAYQAATYIPDLCLSLQAQSFQNFEVLIADDGSPDDIRAAVTPFLLDKRFRFYRSETNQGVAVTTAKLLHIAKGEFWCNPGADDLLEPDFLSARVGLMKDYPSAVLVHGPPHLIDSHGKKISSPWVSLSPEKVTSSPRTLCQLLQHNFINTPSVLVKMSATKAILGSFSLPWRYAQDWFLWLLLAAKGGDFIWDPRVLHRYRVHRVSLTADPGMAATRSTEIRLVPFYALATSRAFSATAEKLWQRWGNALEALWLRRAMLLKLMGQLDPRFVQIGIEASGRSIPSGSLPRIVKMIRTCIKTSWEERRYRQGQLFRVSGLASINDPLFRKSQ